MTLRGEHAVGHGCVAELLERDELPVGVVGEDVGGLDRLAVEDGIVVRTTTLIAVGDEVVRLAAEVAACELAPQFADLPACRG